MQACGGLHAGVVQAKHAGQYRGRPVHAYTHATTVYDPHNVLGFFFSSAYMIYM